MSSLPFAEDSNYWKTGEAGPDTIRRRIEAQVEKLGGTTRLFARGTDEEGRSAFLFEFAIEGDRYRVMWPVLPTRGRPDASAQERQAMSFVYHEVKARALAAAILGTRASFAPYLLLGSGATVGQHLSHGIGDIAGLLPPATA